MWAKYATPPPPPTSGDGELADRRQELEEDPDPEQHHRRYLDEEDEEEEEQRQHPRARIQQRIAAQHRRDRAARPHQRASVDVGSISDLRERRREPAEQIEDRRNRSRPIESSMLLPKIHRNSMLKMMCSQPPCMNIEVKIVRKAGGCVSPRRARLRWRLADSSGVPSQTSLLARRSVRRREPALACPDG